MGAGAVRNLMQAAVKIPVVRARIVAGWHRAAAQEHVHSGLLMGEHAAVSLISSSLDEKAAEANYTIYGVALLLAIQKPPAPQK